MQRVEFDNTRPNVARIYDYLLGGKDHYAVDRAAAARIIAIEPDAAFAARQNRDFLQRVVQFLAAETGVRQFLDIGSGLPTGGNVHEVAQLVAPESKVAYVDNDVTVLAFARAMLTSHPAGACGYVESDVRDIEKIIRDAAKILDFGQPIAVLMFAILHFIPDGEDPHRMVRRLTEAAPPGSYLAISHATPENLVRADDAGGLNSVYAETPSGGVTPRTLTQIQEFFSGLQLVDPGVVDISAWRPADTATAADTRRTLFYGGVARKS